MNRRLSPCPLTRYSFLLSLVGLAIAGLLVWRTPTHFAKAQTCTFTISPSSLNFDVGGGAGGVLVTASQPSCAWAATPNVPWLNITLGANGIGNGPVGFTVAANPDPAPRSGTITVAGQTFTVNQAAGLAGLQYYPLPHPIRLFDTRPPQPGETACAYLNQSLAAGQESSFLARLTCGDVTIPSTALAITGNATVVLPAANGFITLWPNGQTRPTVSNLNYLTSQIVPNAFTVGLGSDGRFRVYSVATTHFIVDVTGYYAPPGAGGLYYHPLPQPIRLFDTRPPQPGETGCEYLNQPLAAGGELVKQARITCNGVTIPADALAITGNATVVLPAANGFITLWPNGQARPTVSNLNYLTSQIVPNAFTVGLGADGQFRTYSVATTHFIVDVAGYFSPSAVDVNGAGLLYSPLAQPIRLFDTRPPQPGETGCEYLNQPLAAGGELVKQARITCNGVTIPADALAITGNATVVLPAANGFITLWPNGQARPTVSNLNYLTSQIVPNAFTVGLGADGQFRTYSVATTHFIVDAAGFYAPSPVNLAPTVAAGADQTIADSGAANLIGFVTDDGLPVGSLSTSWSQVSGPGTAMFGNANQAVTTATFSATGTYVLRLSASDSALSSADDVTIMVNPPLAVNAGSDQVITLPATATLAGAVTGGGPPIAISWSRLSGPGSVLFGNASAAMTTAIFAVEGTYVLHLSATDASGTLSDDVQVTVNADPTPPPPDPMTVAPASDMTVATTVGTATEFLYTGGNPIQTGVAPGTINPVRAAVLKGRVLDKNNTPLPLVKITILSHPEFGQTLSRADGKFDLALNGGGQFTVQYEKTGYLTAQRTETVPWQDYCGVPDVVLMGYDPQVTLVDLQANAPVQVARGTQMSDADGTRQATLMFKQGTTALMKLPGGAMAGLDKLHVRATEFTVGANGAKAMPGELPRLSAYTYAAEYSIDEAVAANATDVSFNQPVIQYNENFLGFPVGTVIPSGTYDRTAGVWMPSSNGLVVKILTITGGQANLDVTGNGQPATDPQYAALGINAAERQQLATLYAVNQSLWRVPLIHFSSWDSNWGSGPPPDAGPPSGPPPSGPPPGNPPGPPDNCPDCAGSIVSLGGQTLGEEVNLTGTPYFLRYDSERTPGYKAGYSLRIPLSDATLPATVKRIELVVMIAGRTVMQTFAAQTNQTTTFTWDGMDAYGRALQGRQTTVIDIGYVYDGTYQNTPRFGYNGNGIPITGNRSRLEVTLHQIEQAHLGTFDFAAATRLGGWSLSAHHVYDPLGRKLYQGDGTRRSVESINSIISTAAGSGNAPGGGCVNDNVPATQACLAFPFDIEYAPDGQYYFTDPPGNAVYRVDTGGIIHRIAGDGVCGFTGDGSQAAQARVCTPEGIALGRDGSVYFADFSNNRIRRIAPDGIITTVVGTGVPGSAGDGGLATQAQVRNPLDVAVMPDGSLYIADGNNHKIRRVDQSGIITTVAGTGAAGFSGDGGPAVQAALLFPEGMAIDANGNLYIADTGNSVVRKVSPQGIISTVVGTAGQLCNPSTAPCGDGGAATQALLSAPTGVHVGPDSSLYVVDAGAKRVRKVTSDGQISNFAGTGNPCATTTGACGDDGAAPNADLGFGTNGPQHIAILPDGSILIGASPDRRIRRVAQPLPGFTNSQLLIPSEDGRELFVFDAAGKHLSTRNTLTGATKFTFGYDGSGRLISVTDGDNNVTTIGRNGAGDPTSIISPFSQTTALALDANGYLSTITNPAGESYQFTYSASGLMATERDPRNNQTNFSYDANGRLTRDDDPASGFQTLARTDQSQSYSVARNTALGRTSSYQQQTFDNGDRVTTITLPSGLQTLQTERTNGTITYQTPDGVATSQTFGPDPRWKMQVPLASASTLTTPGARTLGTTFSRAVTLSNPLDPLSLVTQSDTFGINGRNYTSNFTAATRTFVDATPVGRQTATVIDAQGRTTQQQFANLDPASFGYDARGRLSMATFGIGGGASMFSFAYDTNGFLSSLTDAAGRVGSFSYDGAGRLTQQTLSDNRVIAFGYDANGNLTSVTPPGRAAHSFTYNAVNLMTSYTPPTVPGAGATQFAYNLDRQIATITRPGGLTLSFAYDSAGRLQTLTLPNGAYGYSYSGTTGNLSGITAPGGESLSFSYDGSLLTGTTWAGAVTGSVTRAFDNNIRVTSQSVNGANTINYTYDNDSLIVGAGALTIARDAQNGLVTGTALNSVTDARSYNGLAELSSYSASSGATPLYSAGYTRDKLGRVTQKVETVQGVTDTYDYAYDLAGRLSTVKLNTVTIATYAYDSNSNRASLTTPGGTVTGMYDAQDRMTAYGAAVYAYTANGELQSKTAGAQTTTYSYDVAGNLRSVTLPDSTQIDYVIDGQDRRVGKKVNGVLAQGWLYQNSLKPVAELDGSNNLVSRFVYGSNANTPDYMIKGGATYRIITDHLGSVRLVVDAATGAVAQRLNYDEFGVVTTDTAPGFQPFGFAGGLYDAQTKLVRFGSRDYDAEAGRWTMKDPILFGGEDANLYTYVGNNPLNRLDPSGLADIGDVFNAIGNTLSSVAVGGTTKANGGGGNGNASNTGKPPTTPNQKPPELTPADIKGKSTGQLIDLRKRLLNELADILKQLANPKLCEQQRRKLEERRLQLQNLITAIENELSSRGTNPNQL